MVYAETSLSEAAPTIDSALLADRPGPTRYTRDENPASTAVICDRHPCRSVVSFEVCTSPFRGDEIPNAEGFVSLSDVTGQKRRRRGMFDGCDGCPSFDWVHTVQPRKLFENERYCLVHCNYGIKGSLQYSQW